MLSLTEGRLRQLARRGEMGAAKVGREWTFVRRLVEERARSFGGEVDSGGGGDAELDSMRFERQLLLAEVEAEKRRAEVQRLEAIIAERDAKVSALEARSVELEQRLRSATAAIKELAEALTPVDRQQP